MLVLKECHQSFIHTLNAYINDGIVGRVDFDLDFLYNTISIKMIVVEERFRRQKIATNMLKYLQSKYGDIDWGGKTKDGELLYKSFYAI